MKNIKQSEYSFHKWWKQTIKNPSPIYKDWIKKEGIWLRGNIKKNSRVLDVGCGFGKDIKLLAGIAKDISGIDYNREAVKEARKNLPKFRNINVFLEDARNMHFENNTFDYVICMGNTFGNFGRDKLKILKEMKRVAKPRGKIIVSVYSEKALSTRIENYKKTKVKIKKVGRDGTVVTAEGLISEQFAKLQLKKLFNTVDLKVKITELTPISYLCEATKR